MRLRVYRPRSERIPLKTQSPSPTSRGKLQGRGIIGCGEALLSQPHKKATRQGFWFLESKRSTTSPPNTRLFSTRRDQIVILQTPKFIADTVALVLQTPTRLNRLSRLSSTRKNKYLLSSKRRASAEQRAESSVFKNRSKQQGRQTYKTHLPETLERVEGLRRRMRISAFLLIFSLNEAQHTQVSIGESACGRYTTCNPYHSERLAVKYHFFL